MNTYVGELRTLAQSCNFCTCLHDTLIRNQIVLGLRIGGTRESALKSLRVTKCQTYSKACGLDYDRVMSITWRLLGQRKQRHNIQSKQAENVQTGNATMTGCLREISHVLCVEENTEKVDPTVQLTRDLKR